MLLRRGGRTALSRCRLSAQENQTECQQAYDARQPVPTSQIGPMPVKHGFLCPPSLHRVIAYSALRIIYGLPPLAYGSNGVLLFRGRPTPHRQSGCYSCDGRPLALIIPWAPKDGCRIRDEGRRQGDYLQPSHHDLMLRLDYTPKVALCQACAGIAPRWRARQVSALWS